jgi:hypothetical protein
MGPMARRARKYIVQIVFEHVPLASQFPRRSAYAPDIIVEAKPTRLPSSVSVRRCARRPVRRERLDIVSTCHGDDPPQAYTWKACK